MPPRAIDPGSESVQQALADFAAVAEDCGARYLFVGGAARALAVESGILDARAVPEVRATTDLDFGVQFESQDAFQRFRQRLVQVFSPREDDGQIHFTHRTVSINVDVIPFGPLAQDGRLPVPGRNRDFIVLGFEEALDRAVLLKVGENLWVPVPDGPGFVLLKLIAFGDRRVPHDLQDAVQVMRNFDSAGNQARYFNEFVQEFASEQFNYDEAKYALLGLDIGRIVLPPTYVRVTGILDRLADPGNLDLASVVEHRLVGERLGTTEDAAREFFLLLQGIHKGFDQECRRNSSDDNPPRAEP